MEADYKWSGGGLEVECSHGGVKGGVRSELRQSQGRVKEKMIQRKSEVRQGGVESLRHVKARKTRRQEGGGVEVICRVTEEAKLRWNQGNVELRRIWV